MRFPEWIKKYYRIMLIGLALAAVVFLAVFGVTRIRAKTASTDPDLFPVRINEILTSNGSYPNGDGLCCDFIELYNDSDRAVSLDGFQLSDKILYDLFCHVI